MDDRRLGPMQCMEHGNFNGTICPFCRKPGLRIPLEKAYLQSKWHNWLWFLISDTTALAVGNILFDSGRHSYYAGEITEISESGQFLTVQWDKGSDNKIIEVIMASQLGGLFWADPVQQEDDAHA